MAKDRGKADGKDDFAMRFFRELAKVPLPMAPDDPPDDVTFSVDHDAIRRADIIWAVVPGGPWTLLYSTVNGEEIGLANAFDRKYPADTVVLHVPCRNEHDENELRQVIQRVKHER